MRKGIHIIRALLPEQAALKVCWWCGEHVHAGSWIGVYHPVFAETHHGDRELCWTCAHKCSALAGQPRVPYHFGSTRVRITT